MKKENLKLLNMIMTGIGLIGLVVMSIIAIGESNSGNVTNMASAIVVQFFFAALFISGYISLQKNTN